MTSAGTYSRENQRTLPPKTPDHHRPGVFYVPHKPSRTLRKRKSREVVYPPGSRTPFLSIIRDIQSPRALQRDVVGAISREPDSRSGVYVRGLFQPYPQLVAVCATFRHPIQTAGG